MDKAAILGMVDHTQLKAFATWRDIKKLCDEAKAYKTASVCVPPYYIKRIRENYPELVICTVVGFPLGYSSSAGKLAEVRQALADGVDEVDMVVNVAAVKNHDYDYVLGEIKAIRNILPDKILKVIIETCYLDHEEKKRLCDLVSEAKADYIKTSTGFGTEGATLDDIELFRTYLQPGIKIKAAGGIRTVEQMEKFIEAGCDRLGTSSAVSLLTDGSAGTY
ncbi:MAG: deoxyribose-phosphate aldolase [Planctomycetota bacterium]|jgi:deoxyribose-phosphate aldolase|nr:deoxyribose-phosphate aldolase [Planctomycetota bacterium]